MLERVRDCYLSMAENFEEITRLGKPAVVISGEKVRSKSMQKIVNCSGFFGNDDI